jgi:hypothetical protein
MQFAIIIYFTCLLLSCINAGSLYAQEEKQPLNTVLQIPDKIFDVIDKKTSHIELNLIRQTEKYLSRLQRQENKLKKKLLKKDSTLAKEMFAGAEVKYNKLKKFTGNINKYQTLYSGHLDSLSTALSFLKYDNIKNLASNTALQNAIDQVGSLQGKFSQTEQIKKILAERQRFLRKQFENLGIVKELRKFQRQVYYYRAQVHEYEELFQNTSNLEAKLIELVLKVPRFREFFAKNSILASLFPNPGSSGSSNTGPVLGLQSRAQVVSFMQNQMGSNTSAANSIFQNKLQTAQGQIEALRNKLNSLGGNRSDLEIPDFKPNNQKTKSFFQRLEYGTNVQTTRGNFYFPVTSDLGLSVGFRIDDKNIIGLGASYKVGWGKNISNISVSSQGAGFRSFLDINIKKRFFVSGGFEYNYQQPFQSLNVLNDLSSWQQSGLIGMSKIVSMNTKLFKKTKIQLLWDFLSYQQRPQTQALKFRIGYSF